MGLEELTEGAVLSYSELAEYGLEPTELKLGDGPRLYEKDRTRVCLEPRGGKYFVGAVYELPKIG